MKKTKYLLAGAVTGIFLPGSLSASEKPDILLIVADDLGYGDLHCFGAEDMRTPVLDGLASEGIRFTNFHSNSSVSSPSRASILTGMFPDLVGVPGVIRSNAKGNYGYLSEDAHLLPEYLKELGYNTSMIGKWHLGLSSPNLPNDRGFDYFKGWLEGMTDYYKHQRGGVNYMRENRSEIETSGRHVTELFTEWAIDYIRSLKSDESMFMMLSYTAPHVPIQPPAEFLEKVKKREKGISDKRAAIVALIEHMDYNIGKVIEELKRTSRYDNTLIFFVSDNGGQLEYGASNGVYRGEKGNMWEGGIRVSAIASWKNAIKESYVNDNLLMHMDIFPTIISLCGGDIPDGINGKPFDGIINGSGYIEENRPLIWVRREGGSGSGNPYFGVRYGKYKFVQNHPYEEMKLYDMENDEQERKELPVKDYPEKTKKLKSILQSHIAKSGRIPWQKL